MMDNVRIRVPSEPSVRVTVAGSLHPLGDNLLAWQKFEELKVTTKVCKKHDTAIAANNGTHRIHNMEHYNEFYELICHIM